MEQRRLASFLPDIKDLYTITSDGEVYSDNVGKMKSRNRAGSEYQIINFMKNDGTKACYRLHRLVMMAFQPIPNPSEMEVNHKDGNKKNNKLSNLEWCTSSENQRHAFRTGLQKPRRGEKSNFSKLKEADVLKVFDLYNKNWSHTDIAAEVGCSSANIYSILSGKSWTYLRGSTTMADMPVEQQNSSK